MARERVKKERYSYPPDLSDHTVHPACIEFKFFERQSPTESSPLNTVHLYMPEAVSQPSTVDWGDSNLGFIGNAIVQGTNRTMATLKGSMGAMDFIKSNLELMNDGATLAGTYGLANLGSMAASLMGGNVSAEGIMGAIGGIIPNPYVTCLFKGVGLREFSFVFKFYPFREEDCQEIYDIISVFRENALPSYDGGAGLFTDAPGKSLLAFPAECDIRYMWMDKDNEWLHKFRRAVCTAIDIDYTGQGMFSTMRNGFPSEITMSTKWKETVIITREDIAEGY